MNYLKYSKYAFIFITIELMISFIASLLNLLGVNSGITSIVLLVSNGILFFILAFLNGKTSKSKGYLSGLVLSIIFILIMFIINSLLFGLNIKLGTIIYYIILIMISIFAGSIGINKKKDNNYEFVIVD